MGMGTGEASVALEGQRESEEGEILYMFPILRVFCVKFEVFSKLTNYENFNVKC